MRGVNQNQHLKRMQKLILVITVLLSLSVIPADAANTTITNYVVQDQPYTPYPVFLLTLGLGVIFLILSLTLSGEQNNDAFAALAIIPLFVASWMALQLDIPMGGVTGTVTDSVLRVDHLIYPQSILAAVIFVMFCGSIYQLYRLMSANKLGSSDDGWKEKDYDPNN